MTAFPAHVALQDDIRMGCHNWPLRGRAPALRSQSAVDAATLDRKPEVLLPSKPGTAMAYPPPRALLTQQNLPEAEN